MIWQYYTSQLIAVAFAIATAKHDAPAVIRFGDRGVSGQEMSKFHRYNTWLKSLFCIYVAIVFLPDCKSAFFAGVSAFLWIYLLFDIVLNLNIPNRNWTYIGENDADGRRWKKWFAVNPGLKKALILSVLIVVTNILKIVLS